MKYFNENYIQEFSQTKDIPEKQNILEKGVREFLGTEYEFIE